MKRQLDLNLFKPMEIDGHIMSDVPDNNEIQHKRIKEFHSCLTEKMFRDLWDYIFDVLNYKRTDPAQWLSLNSVCKTWHRIIHECQHISLLVTKFNPQRFLNRFPNLRYLEIDPSFKFDVRQHTKLTSLNFSHHNGPVLRSISQDYLLNLLTNLTELSLGNNPYVSSDSNTDDLALLTRLRKLSLQENKDIDKRSIKDLTNLTHLDISDTTQFADADIAHLTRLTHLAICNNPSITPNGMRNLPNLTHIVTSNIYHFQEFSYGTYVDQANQHMYTGEWLGGRRHGFGRMDWNKNIIYEGVWTDDKSDGKGTFMKNPVVRPVKKVND